MEYSQPNTALVGYALDILLEDYECRQKSTPQS